MKKSIEMKCDKFLCFFKFCIVLFSAIRVEGTCFTEFNVASELASTSDLNTITSEVLSFEANVSETLDEGSILYRISWQDPLTRSPYVKDEDDDTALDYIEYEANETAMVFAVNNSMIGLIDFDNSDRTDTLLLSLYFEFTTLQDSVCELYIVHNIVDQNTNAPHFEYSSYDISVREDYPVQLTLPDFNPIVYDLDASSPNNEFEIEMDSECPLEPTASLYTCEEGATTPAVQFQLGTPLDYDAMTDPFQYTCTATLTDHGDPNMSSSTVITLDVIAFADEQPAFSSFYYKGQLLQSTVGSTVSMEPVIEATDLDQPPTTVTYAMEAADDTVGGDEYFSISSSTGQVTVTKDIDGAFLSYRDVDFLLTVCDEDDQCSTSFLDIELPYLSCNETSVLFEQLKYTVEDYPPSLGEELLLVHAQSSQNQEDVVYSWAEDGSLGLNYFGINVTSGSITAIQSNTPSDHYVLVAMATDGIDTDQTSVNIVILTETEEIFTMKESLVLTSIQENNDQTLLYTAEAEGAQFYCMTAVHPQEFAPYFMVDNSTGELYAYPNLDSENTDLGYTAAIKISAFANETQCVPSPITNQLDGNEMIVDVVISDENEFSPFFQDAAGNIVSQILFAYPLEPSLQRTVGPVATVLVEDSDRTDDSPNLTLEDESESFEIDGITGNIYLVGSFNCESACYFVVYADDFVHNRTELEVYVTELDTDHIFTMTFQNVDMSSVQSMVEQISNATNMSLYILYTNVIGTESPSRGARAELWQIEAHVYAVVGMDLVDYDQFVSTLESNEFTTTVAPFSDKKYFEEQVTNDYEGFKAATIALGCILALVLLMFAGLVLYLKVYKEKKSPSSYGQINTLGKAYKNPNFKTDEPSFASIFGDDPVKFSSERSTSSADDNSVSSGKELISYTSTKPYTPKILKDVIITSSPSLSVPPSPPPLDYDGAQFKQKEDNSSLELDEFGAKMERRTSTVYPSLELTGAYEDEIEDVVSSFSKLRGSLTLQFSSSVSPTAPPLEIDLKDDISMKGDHKKSSLKPQPDLDLDDEPKSVAFKILVDTKEFADDEPSDGRPQVDQEEEQEQQLTVSEASSL